MLGIIYGGGVALLICSLGLLVWRKFGSIFALLLPFMYGYFSVFLSCLYLELYPSFIFEQERYSFFNGASLLLFVVLLFSVLSVVFVFQNLSRVVGVQKEGRSLLSKKALFSVVVLEGVLIAHVFLSGSPLFEVGVTKFSFWRDQAILEPLSIFNWALYPVIFVVGANGAFFMYSKSRVSWFLSVLVLVFGCLYYVSWGNKFSALLLVVFLYFIPGVIAFRRRFGFSYPIVSRTFALGLGFLFLIIGLVSSQYERFQSRGLDAREQLIERVFVLQGHVWWGSVGAVLAGGPDFDQAAKELGSVFRRDDSDSVGMRYMMKKLAPEYLYSSYLESGVEYTGGYPAILVLIFGLFGGVLFSVVLWGFYGFFLFYLARLISIGSRVRLFFSSYLYITSFAWFQHGSISSFINWKFLVVCLFLLSLEIVFYLRGLEKQASQEVCNV